MRILISLLLWLPFAVFSIVAVVLSPFAILLEEWTYAKDLGRAMDKLGAAVMGWGGHFTISAECGRRKCHFCTFVCWMLDFVDKGHCAGAAEREKINA
jgi:hypothetical protein